ncbi:MAG: hypothetical protein EOP14_04190 [Pseudomonas sp.]|jgi:hypothetical protein|nr:MAG: hypothetical protein EOP14_04190 [Pseudomonas sp.]
MPKFILHIQDGVEAEVEIDVANAHTAVNDGYNALAIFVARKFPPAESITITVSDSSRGLIAVLGFTFSVQYAPGFLS